MLMINNTKHPFRDGMTIKGLLEEKGFVFHRIIVKLNGRIMEDADYAGTLLSDGDDVQAIHVYAGG